MNPTPRQVDTEAGIQAAYSAPEVAEKYVQIRFENDLMRLLHDRQVAAVRRLIAAHRPARILEIAPGPGRITRHITPPGRLVCLEYNEGMIAEGRAACGPNVQWVQGNAFELPFEEPFDLVYTFRFIRHFRRGDRDRLYAQIRRALRPGGHFLFDAVNARVARPVRDADPDGYAIFDELYTADELRRELTEAGFVVREMPPVQKFFLRQRQSQILLGPRANWLNRLVIRGLEKLPRREGLEWIVTCQRQ